MKITDPGTQLIVEATRGDLAAIDKLLLLIQPGIYNLSVRMLGNRDDAADATQEILLQVITHLGSYRGEAEFATWTYAIARNHLLRAHTRTKESPEVSFDSMSEYLKRGLDTGASLGDPSGSVSALTPEDKAAAAQVALSCTQNMLMSLDRDHRLAYVLDIALGLSSSEAAAVLDIAPTLYRKRLSRARSKLDAFTTQNCGLVNTQAACHCQKQLPAIKHMAASVMDKPSRLQTIHRIDRKEAQQQFDAMVRASDAAALIRGHPTYLAPESIVSAIRSILRREGWWDDQKRTH